MSNDFLPPLLAQSYDHLVAKPSSPQHAALLKELQTVSQIVGLAVEGGLRGPALRDLEQLRSGITTSGGKVCECCLRPFTTG